MDIKELDRLFEIYGYEIRKEDESSRAYLLRQGMYFGAEIFSTTGISEEISRKYKESDYACKVENFNNIEEAERYLFNGFFQTNLTECRINDKYRNFAESQVKQYKDPSIRYEYINVPYKRFDDNAECDIVRDNLIGDINDIIQRKGAYLIIVEAAAGFGKTCTAFELYKSFERYCNQKRPLFTELTRNRTQKLFKYVLRDEIEQEYKYGINTDLVVYNIKKGNIPFIIDGFDELLTKDIDKGIASEYNEFDEVETMLSTIGDMLEDEAKIILTSRKTAIFAGEDFNRWVEKYGDSFKVVRFQIEKPEISHWLSDEKMKLLLELNVPIQFISNPVLLTYLKNISLEKFKYVIEDSEKITDKYFEFLLEREKIRQEIVIDKDDQKLIFQNLAKEFYKYDINCEERNFIKLFIGEGNKKLLAEYGEKSPQTEEELLDTLTNHALLDRYAMKKNKEYIGFVNDFVFGYLSGNAIIQDSVSFLSEIHENQLDKIFGAFKYCGDNKRFMLWDILNEYRDLFTQRTKVSLDINLKNTILGEYCNEAFNSYEFSSIHFKKNQISFSHVTFTDTTFRNCIFDKDVFDDTYFIGCIFSECEIRNNCDYNQIQCFGCEDFNSGFVSRFNSKGTKTKLVSCCDVSDDEIEKMLLSKYFKVDNRNFKMKLISTIKDDFSNYDLNQVYNIFHRLKKEGFILQNGNNSHITKQGSNYYHKKYGNV